MPKEKILEKKNLIIDENEKLLDEVNNLVDQPHIIECSFDKKFLTIPQEILVLTMQSHQKYFPLFTKKKEITNEFIVVTNKKDNKGLTEITVGPAGLTLVHRRVYEKLMKDHPHLKIKQKEIISEKANSYFYNFWDTVFDQKSGYWWGEDTHFCNLATQAGFKFYAVVDGETTHHGSFGFTGTLLDTFKRTDEKAN